MKKLILLSVLFAAMPLSMLAQDDDMYFVPTKANEAKDAKTYGMPSKTYYSGSNRSVDDYNRRAWSRVAPIDSAGNDIIDFNAVKGVYPDSAYTEVADDDFRYTRRMSRFDDYTWADPYWAGYYAGRATWGGWYDPWYYGGWYDPWHYRGWYDPWYYGGWYSPWHYGSYYGYYGWYGPRYYGGRYVSSPRRVETPRQHFGRGTGNSVRGSRSSFGASRSNTAPSRSYSPSHSSSNSSFGGSRSTGGSFGGTRSSGGGGGVSRGGGGFGRHR